MGWIHGRESRSAVIAPVSVANPGDSWITQGFGGQTSSSGITVTEQVAKKLSAVYACRQILAETVATTSLYLKQRLPNGSTRFATEHPLYPILLNIACPDLPGVPAVTAFAFKEFLQSGLALRGKGYAQKIRNGRGQIIGLNPLRSDRMMVSAFNGQVRYEYSRDDGPMRQFQPDELLRLHYCLDDDRVTPISPIRANAEALGIAIAVNRYGGQMFANGVASSGILKHPGKISEPAYKRLHDQLAERTVAGGKSHAGLILEEGLEWQNVSINPEDAQALESRVFSIREICRIYRIPPHMVADLERSTNNNIEQQSLEFAQYAMMPWFERWEQSIEMDLLTAEERAAGYYAEYDIEELTRGDTAARISLFTAGRQWGYFSANDVLRKLNMPLLGDAGDVYLTPVNMIPADQVAELTGKTPPSSKDKPQPEGGDPGAESARSLLEKIRQRTEQRLASQAAERSALMSRRIAKQYRSLFEDAFGRVVAREAKDVRRLVKRHLESSGQTDFGEEITQAFTEISAFCERTLRGLVTSYVEAVYQSECEILGQSGEVTPEVEAFSAERSQAHGAEHSSQTRLQVRELQLTGEPELVAERIEASLAEWEKRAAADAADHAVTSLGDDARALARRMAGV